MPKPPDQKLPDLKVNLQSQFVKGKRDRFGQTRRELQEKRNMPGPGSYSTERLRPGFQRSPGNVVRENMQKKMSFERLRKSDEQQEPIYFHLPRDSNQ